MYFHGSLKTIWQWFTKIASPWNCFSHLVSAKQTLNFRRTFQALMLKEVLSLESSWVWCFDVGIKMPSKYWTAWPDFDFFQFSNLLTSKGNHSGLQCSTSIKHNWKSLQKSLETSLNLDQVQQFHRKENFKTILLKFDLLEAFWKHHGGDIWKLCNLYSKWDI